MANYYGGSGNDLVLAWADNRPFAWGANDLGNLGDNTTTNRFLPVPVTATGVLAGRTVVALAGGYYLSVALCADGTVAAWSDNRYGQLGNSTTNSSLVPVAVNTAAGMSALYGKTVVAISAGRNHSLALCSDGTVAAWGNNDYGQIGDNTTTSRDVPVAVNTAPGISVLSNKTVVAIAAGSLHSLALCSDGTVAAWGWNGWGQIGDNTTTQRNVPVAVNTASGSALHGKTVQAIAAGAHHNLALCWDGTVVAWGYNNSGQLGDNTYTQRNAPVAVNTNSDVSALYGKTVLAIAAGTYHSLALSSDGSALSWGNNRLGQLGDNTTTQRSVPVAVTTNSGISALYGKTLVGIAAGAWHNLALCDGTVAAWGLNAAGQLGDNITESQHNAPVAVTTTPLAVGQRFARVASGSTANQTLALVAAPPASQIKLTGAQTLTNGSFQFTFTNTAGAFFGVLVTTNPALPLSNWTPLDGLTEVTPGQFQFTDAQATNSPQRFYRVRSP